MSTMPASLRQTSYFILILSAAYRASADSNFIARDKYCASACTSALSSVRFAGESHSAAGNLPCTNLLFSDSLFSCVSIYCSPSEISSGLPYENRTCQEKGSPLPSYRSFLESQASQSLGNVTSIAQAQIKNTTFREPVIPDQEYYTLAYRSTAALNNGQALDWDLVWSLYGYWGLVILVGLANRTFRLMKNLGPKSRLQPSAAYSWPLAKRLRYWFRRYIAIPLVITGSKADWCTSPTRLQALLVALYMIMNFIYCFPGYQLIEGDLFLAETKTQLGRYIALRTGSLALANIPVIWIFAARNEPLLWLTGWSYTTYNQFHRWTARMTALLAVVHAIAFSVTYSYEGKYSKVWDETFWNCGLVAVIFMSLLVASSIYLVRKRAYDLFLVIHIGFAIVILATIYYHVKIPFPNVYNGFIWAAVAIWGFDRVLRIARVASLSLVPSLKRAKAVASYDGGWNMIRLDVTDCLLNHNPPPGAYYFIYEPGALRGYESHPFTLCSWPSDMAAERVVSAQSSLNGSDDVKVKDDASDSDQNTSLELALQSPTPQSPPKRHTFLICPRRGFTKRLRKKAEADEEAASGQLTILLEGPYGSPEALDCYPSVLFIAGGSGITTMVSRIHALLTEPMTTRVHLVWAVADRSFATDVFANELKAMLTNPRAQIDVYVTRGNSGNTESLERTAGKATQDLPANTPLYTLHLGRPELASIIANDRTRAASGILAVLSCGPRALDESVRSATCEQLATSGAEVKLYQERFEW